MKSVKPWRITIGLGLIVFSFIWAKIGPLLGFGLQYAPIEEHWREDLPLQPWQLYLSSWIIGLIGVLIAGKEGWVWMRNQMKEWKRENIRKKWRERKEKIKKLKENKHKNNTH